MPKERDEISVIKACAYRILKEIDDHSDLKEINQILAELEPYPLYIISIKEVK